MTVAPEVLADAFHKLGVDESAPIEAVADAVTAGVGLALPALLAAIAENRKDAVIATAALLDASDLVARHAPEASTPEADAEPESDLELIPARAQKAAGKPKAASKPKSPSKLEWPALPTEAQVRELLTAWATTARFVDPATFAGDLAISDSTICRTKVVRLIETRGEASASEPGERARVDGTYANSITLVEKKAATAFKAQRWELALEGSIVTQRCPGGCSNGKHRCRRCGGQGMNPCPTTMRCGACRGSGTQTTYGNAGASQTRCSQCAGRGDVRCSKCGGKGQTQCWSCMAQGWTTCKTCAGTGALTRFTKGTIDRRLDEIGFETKSAAEIALPKAPVWDKHGPFPHHEPLGILPEEVLTPLESELKKRPSGELLRKVVVETFPIVTVTYTHRGEQRTAYLLGQERAVQARGVRGLRLGGGIRAGLRSRKVRWLALLAVVSAVGIGVAAVVAGREQAPAGAPVSAAPPVSAGQITGSGFHTRDRQVSCTAADVGLTCLVLGPRRKVDIPREGMPRDGTATASPAFWSSMDASAGSSAATGTLRTNWTWSHSGFHCRRTEQYGVWRVACFNPSGHELEMIGSSGVATSIFVTAPGGTASQW